MNPNHLHGIRRGNGYRILFYVERDLHLPFLEPIHDWFQANSECELAFGVAAFRESREGAPGFGLKGEELARLGAKVRLVDSAEAFRPHATICADACTGLKNCGKLVFVGHGIISKGGFYTTGQLVRRENLADLICVPGPLHKEILEKSVFSPIRVTGFIKSDRMFARGVPSRESARRHYGLPADARVVLFAPTFNPEMSSLYVIGERVRELCADGVYLMVKLHTMTDLSWKQRFRALAADCERLSYCEEIDVTPAMLAADVLVTDVSSVMAEFMFLDRPVVVVDNPRLTEYPQYRADDIEYRVRDTATIRVADIEELKAAVTRSIERPEEFSSQRRAMTEALCFGRDGLAAERAALAVLDLLELPPPAAQFACTVVVTWPATHLPSSVQLFEQELAEQNPGVAVRCLHSGLPAASRAGLHTTCPTYSPAWLAEIARMAEGELIVLLQPGLRLPFGWLKRLSHYFRWHCDAAWVQPFSHHDDLPLLADVIGQLLPGQEQISFGALAEALATGLIGYDLPLVVPDNLCIMFKRRHFEMLGTLPAMAPKDFLLQAVRTIVELGGTVLQAPDILIYPKELTDDVAFTKQGAHRSAFREVGIAACTQAPEATVSPGPPDCTRRAVVASQPSVVAPPPIFEETIASPGGPSGNGDALGVTVETSPKQHEFQRRQPMPDNDPRYEILKDSYRELQSQIEAQFLLSAIERVEHFLKYDPGHALAHNDLGVLYFRKGDKLQALGHCQKANHLSPDNPAFQKNLANFYLDEMGWVDEAFELFQLVVQEAPDDIESLLALATISSGAGKAEQARAYMDKILALHAGSAAPAAGQPTPETAEPWSSPGLAMPEAAPQPLPLAIQPPPRKDAEDLYLEARDRAEKGETADAIELLEELLSLFPKHGLAHNDLGVLYLRIGDATSSLSHHKSACAIEPDNGTFARNLAGLYLDRGMTDEAIFALSERLKRQPDDLETLAGLGNISLSLDRTEEATIFFEKILALEPWNRTAREAVSSLKNTPVPNAEPFGAPQPASPDAAAAPYRAASSAEQTTASLDQLLARLRATAPPRTEVSLENRYRDAQLAVEAGRPDDAIDRLESLIANHPEFAPAYNDLGVLYYQRGNPERALDRHREAVSLKPEDIDFKKNLAGLCLTDEATLDEAIFLLTEIVELHPRDIETLFALGRSCFIKQRPEEAKIFLRRLLELEPWHREAQDLLTQVNQVDL